MSVVTTTDQSVISTADTIVNTFVANGVTSLAVEPDINIEGTGSWTGKTFKIGLGGIGFDFGAGLQDLANKLLFFWVVTLDAVDTKANGGWRIRVSSDADPGENNYGEWFVDGSDTYRAIVEGYGILIADTSLAFDATLGTAPALSSVRSVVAIANHLTASSRATFFVDKSSFGTGITIKGGTTIAPGISSEIAISDESNINARGVFKNIAGAMYITGKLTFGDTAAVDSYFRDTNQFWLFEDKKVGITRHQVVGVGEGLNAHEFSLGVKVGTGVTASGISGNTLKADGAPYRLIFTDANLITNFFGCSFINSATQGGTIQLEHANIECISCLFASCGIITIRSGAIFKKATITASSTIATQAALDFGPTNPNATADSVRDITLIGGVNGIRLVPTANTTYDFPNIKFSGQSGKKVRIEAPEGRLVTINILGGGDAIANPGDLDLSGGILTGNVTINNNITITVTVKDEAGVAIQGAIVSLRLDTDNSEILSGATNASGVVTGSTSGSPGGVSLIVRKATGTTNDFINVNRAENIGATDINLSVTLVADPKNIN